jgi:leucyl aminopeptidase (aminopeptidase T)
MNERIKQLWEEAAKTTQSDSWEEQTKFMERFAELIVRKCISEVAMMGVVHYENPDISWAVNLIIGNLKETFELDKLKEKNI